MPCHLKRYSSFISGDEGKNLKIRINVYGNCEEYFPLASKKYVEHLVRSIVPSKEKISYEVFSHSDKNCNYTHPVESWVKCDFQEDFNQHCLQLCQETDEGEFTHTLNIPFNTVFLGVKNIPPQGEIEYFSMNILSENYLLTSGALNQSPKSHRAIPSLGKEEWSQLLCSMDWMNDHYITLADAFDEKYLNIRAESKIFLIPSIINISKDNKIGKNIYSPEERFAQTLSQVRSIKVLVEDAVVLILELSSMNLRQIHQMRKFADGIVFFNQDPKAQEYAHDPNKNKAEVYLQSYILDRIKKPFSHFCKFGGRYSLTDKFDPNTFFSNYLSFRIIPRAHDGKSIVESILYSVPYKYVNDFTDILIHIQAILDRKFDDVEHLLYRYCVTLYRLPCFDVKFLGIRGHFAGSGAFNSS